MKKHYNPKDNRSQKYQYLILECNWDYNALCTFPDESDKNYEQISCLRDRLIEEVKRIMKERLTQHQRDVLEMYYFEDMTQTEISKVIGTNQSSIVKSIAGNRTKNADGTVLAYGGSIKKLKKYCHEDKIILGILEEISDLSS